MLIRWKIITILLLALILSSEAKLYSELTCHNTDSTMIYYSRLRDANLMESDYTQGLKTGSINYLVNGSMDFSDTLNYYYGETSDEGKLIQSENTSLVHEQHVNFKGEKGISEFYGKGFFKNNRAMSAWKKIRYDDLRNIPGPYGLGPTYLSPNITVDARVDMNRKPGLKYDFNYYATVDNGVLDFYDSTGWTNKSGARRIDYEQTGLLKGKRLKVTNILSDEDLKAPAAGLLEDWLPCGCWGITPVEGLDSGWPNPLTYLVLKPKMILPKNYTNDTYAGIFSYPGGAVQRYPGSTAPAESQVETAYGVTRISVQKFVEKEIKDPDDLVEYTILVRNTGDTPLFDVRLTDILPEGMVISDWEEIDENGDLVPSNESQFSAIDVTERSIILRLGNLDRDVSKWLVLKARMNTDAWLKDKNIYWNNQVLATGEYKGIRVESTATPVLNPRPSQTTAPSGEEIP